jgi:preprotein translocase subunit YajC
MRGPFVRRTAIPEGPMLISPAYAQTAGAAEATTAASIATFAPLVLIFVVFYFLMIRPQQKRQRALQDAVNAVKKGDSVVTAGGILGKVTKVEDAVVELEIAANTRIRVVKATLVEVTPLGSKPAND